MWIPTNHCNFTKKILYILVDISKVFCYNKNSVIVGWGAPASAFVTCKRLEFFTQEVNHETRNIQILQYPAGAMYGIQHGTGGGPRSVSARCALPEAQQQLAL